RVDAHAHRPGRHADGRDRRQRPDDPARGVQRRRDRGPGGRRGPRSRGGAAGRAGVDAVAGARRRARGRTEPGAGAGPSREQRRALHARRGPRRSGRLAWPRSARVRGERYRGGHRAGAPAAPRRAGVRGARFAPAPLVEHPRVRVRGARARHSDRPRHRGGPRRPAPDREPPRVRHHGHDLDPGGARHAARGGGMSNLRPVGRVGATTAGRRPTLRAWHLPAAAMILALFPVAALALEGPEIQWRGLLDVVLAERGQAYDLNVLTRGDASFDAYGMRLFADGQVGDRLQIFGQLVLRDASGVYVEGAYATFTPDAQRDLHLLAGKIPWA